jgi:thymidylate synthase (FAD)
MKIVNMDVEYVDHMGSDLSVVNAARVSFDKESELDDNGELTTADQKLINYLAKHNHWSPFAHTSVSFRVKAPIFVARQLVKHTVGFSWNEVSRRYVDSEPEFYLPDVWRARADNVKQGSSNNTVDRNEDMKTAVYEAVKESLHTYNYMLDWGVCPEQARMVLPQNTMTEWIWTGSVYAFARMCQLRLDSHTQVETREIAQMISEHMISLYPISWKVLLNDSSSN